MFGLVLLAAIPLGGRGFCTHLCWWGPLNAVGGRVGRLLRLPQLELATDPARWSGCHRCDRACPVGVAVSTMVQLGARPPGDCVLCGSRADACPSGAAKLAFRRAARAPCADRTRKASA
jgi:ferredoxin-type protein NapH